MSISREIATDMPPTRPEAVRLSICMPTYNFGEFIGEALSSILSQVDHRVEVVVLDSGSTDDTAQTVKRFAMLHPQLRYVYADQRQGIDRDLARTVELACGEYCWLFSADDVMLPGALAQVLAEIGSEDDIYLCAHSDDSLRMETINAFHPVFNMAEAISVDLSVADHQRRYFELASTTEAFFSFMGGLIVRKSAWNREAPSEAFVGSCWAHAARLLALSRTGLRVRYMHRVLLRRRADNDSFAIHGTVRRFALAIDGYLRIAEHFWGTRSEQAFHVRRVLRNEFRLGPLLYAKRKCALHPVQEDRKELNRLVTAIYADATPGCAVTRLAFHLVPAFAFAPLLGMRGLLRRLFA